jgi:hypothetical protein
VIKREGKRENGHAVNSEEEQSATHSDRGEDALEARNRTDEEDGGGGFIHRYCRQKTNLEISTSQHNPDGDGDGCPTECPICFADFEVGDKICWSNNADCVHTFHIACLEPWLMKHDECPLCRAQYLVPPKEAPLSDMRTTTTQRGTSPITHRVVAALSLLFFFRRTVQSLEHARQNQEEEANQEIDGVPEISVDNHHNAINDDDDPPSPTMIPLEDVSDCSISDEEMTPPTDIEIGEAER